MRDDRISDILRFWERLEKSMSSCLIDVHSHPLFPAYRRALAEASGGSDEEVVDEVPLPAWSVEQHLDTMEREGIDVCILSLPDATQSRDGAGASTLARELNEELAELVVAHPTRFGALATLPMDDLDAALEELAYTTDVLQLDGVAVPTHYRGEYIGEGAFDPLLEELNRRSATLFVHPTAPPGFESTKSRLNVSALEFMFESTRMVATMIMSGTKQRFDKIKIISTHAGGTIPYLANRLALISQMPWAYRDGPRLTADAMFSAFGSFYYDLTASTSATSLSALRHLVPPERLLMGFDFPFMPSKTIAPARQAFDDTPIFASPDKIKILSENALELFSRFKSSSKGPSRS